MSHKMAARNELHSFRDPRLFRELADVNGKWNAGAKGSYTRLCLVMAEEVRAASLVLVGNSSGPRGPEEQAAYRDG